jgi:predicted nucleic acid-binding protein
MKRGAERFSRLVFDTSAYSWLRRGRDEVLDFVARAEVVILPVTVLGELEAAYRSGTKTRENQMMLQEFLAEPFVTLWPTTESVAAHYGELIADLKEKGTPIPSNDAWIAAATLACGGHLLTFDRHYRDLKGLAATILEP